jgi:hypothetical protein
MTNTTREFNLSNWTGQTATVAYKVKDDAIFFEFYGYRFEITKLDNEGLRFEDKSANEGWRTLYGSEWSDELTTLFFVDEDGKDHERAVIKAVRWIANHV